MVMRHGPEALLCERCGYHLRGLAREDHCPECGKLILESLYSSRRGTRWQRDPTWRAWLATTLEMVRHPRTFWDRVRFGEDSPSPDQYNSFFNLVLVSVLPGVLWLILSYIVLGDVNTLYFLVVWPIYTIVVVAGMSICSWLEARGCLVISRVHGWRVPGFAIWMIVDHASIGWAVGGFALCIYLIAAIAIDDVVLLYIIVTQHDLVDWLPYAFIVSTLVGLVCFETLVYFGLRRLKYANMPGAEAELVEASGGGAEGPASGRGEGEAPGDSGG